MAAYPVRLTKFLEEYRAIGDPDTRSDFLLELAERLQPVPEAIATRPYPRSHLVQGCESEAYLFAETISGPSLRLHFAIDNPQGVSAKAIAVILTEGLSGAPLKEIAEIDDSLIFELFGANMTMAKGQGLTAMVTAVRSLARKSLPHGNMP